MKTAGQRPISIALASLIAIVPLWLSHSGAVVAQGVPLTAEQSLVSSIGDQVVETAGSAIMAAPQGRVKMQWQSQMPDLTNAQMVEANKALHKVNLPGPALDANAATPLVALPLAESNAASVVKEQPLRVMESVATNNEEDQPLAPAAQPISPQAPPDALLFRNVAPVTTSGTKSNVLEASVAQSGKYAFFTGNWFAARSITGGSTWSYISPYADMSDFCCDQVTIHNESRDILFWYRQGLRNSSGVNKFRLGVSTNGGASFCNYDINPTGTNSTWTNQWWDYPHLQIGADYLYIATNMFNASDQWTRTVLLRWPLDSLRTCAGFSYNYYSSTTWFTFVPVQGADHIMYFASDWPSTAPANSRINIWTWNENSTTVASTTKTVAAWTTTNRNGVCGSATGNWVTRADQKLLTGARYMIHGNSLQIPGRKVLGWWWNVRAGGSFAQPYIEGAAFYEDNLTQLSGVQGRPLIWNSSTCYHFPSAAANRRGDLALVFNYGTGTNQNPSVAFAIADDNVPTPPGFSLSSVRISNARPSDNNWGDFNTVRPFYPTEDVWVAGAHYIPNTTNCTGCGSPIFFAFGRERDFASWNRWQLN